MKEYMGDSVYAEVWNSPAGGGIVLTTNNGLGPTNIIYLEPEVIKVILSFIKRAEVEPT